MSISRLMQKSAAGSTRSAPRTLNELPSGGPTHVAIVDGRAVINIFNVIDPYNPVLTESADFDGGDVRRTEFDPVNGILFIPDYGADNTGASGFYFQSVNIQDRSSSYRADGISHGNIFDNSLGVAVDPSRRLAYNVTYYTVIEKYSYSTSGTLSSTGSGSFNDDRPRSRTASVVLSNGDLVTDNTTFDTSSMTHTEVVLPSVSRAYGVSSGSTYFNVDPLNDNLSIFNMNNVYSPTLYDSFTDSSILGSVRDIDLDETNDTVVTAGNGILAVFDVSNLNSISLKGYIDDPENIGDGSVSIDSTRGLVYTSTADGFSVYDLEFSQGGQPIFMNKISTTASGYGTGYTSIYAY